MKTEDSNWKGPVRIGLPCTLPIKGDNRNTIAVSHCYSIPFQNASSPYSLVTMSILPPALRHNAEMSNYNA